jgi:hypothetical protein
MSVEEKIKTLMYAQIGGKNISWPVELPSEIKKLVLKTAVKNENNEIKKQHDRDNRLIDTEQRKDCEVKACFIGQRIKYVELDHYNHTIVIHSIEFESGDIVELNGSIECEGAHITKWKRKSMSNAN